MWFVSAKFQWELVTLLFDRSLLLFMLLYRCAQLSEHTYGTEYYWYCCQYCLGFLIPRHHKVWCFIVTKKTLLKMLMAFCKNKQNATKVMSISKIGVFSHGLTFNKIKLILVSLFLELIEVKTVNFHILWPKGYSISGLSHSFFQRFNTEQLTIAGPIFFYTIV